MADETADGEDVAASKAPLIEHLTELRSRLFKTIFVFFVVFIIAYVFSKEIFNFLVEPLADVEAKKGREFTMIYTALHEAFFTRLKVSFFTALFVTSPFFLSQIYKFAAPGLYKNERRAFLPFLFATPILFVAGAALVYYFIFPRAWGFLAGFQDFTDGETTLQLLPKVNEYLSLSMKLIFAFGLSFQLPVALTLLARAGIVSSQMLAKNRKYAVVIAFVAAAVLTPPDPFSQIGLGLPILILYEVSIFLAKIIERKRAEKEKEREAELDA